MSVLTVIKKVGEKILSVVEYPFKKADEIESILSTGIEEFPATKDALIGTVQRLEALGPEVLAALASKGIDFEADAEAVAGIKAFFTYAKDTLFPVVEADFKAIKSDVAAPAPAATLPSPTAAVEHVPVAAQ